jgi:hypothetical protein
MTISSQQIHNVLRTYGKQLRRGLRLNRMKQAESVGTPDQVRISSEAKRMMVVERVAAEILLRLADPVNNKGEVEREIISSLNKEYGQPLRLGFDSEHDRFKFDVIDESTGEIVKSLTSEETMQLNQRLAQITKETVDRTML